MTTTHSIQLELHKKASRVPPQVVVRQGEAGTQVIKAALTNDGASYTPTATSARLDVLHADGTWARVSATKSSGAVSCTLPSAALSSHGRCKLAHFVFYDGTTAVETTEGFELVILPAVDASDAAEAAKDYDDMLTALWEKWDAYEREAEAAETARASAESARASAEKARATAEQGRVTAEAARVDAESARVSELATLKSQSQAATNAANGAATNATNAATYARSVADGLQSSVVGDEDVAQMRGEIDSLGSLVADLKEDFYVMGQAVYAPASKASKSGAAVTLASTCSASGTAITLA